MRYICIITIILSHITSFAQDFGAVGTEWYYTQVGNLLAPHNSEYLHLQSIADTVIEDRTCHKIIQTYYTYFNDTANYPPHYIYEESDTLFIYDFEQSKFIIMYIFNVSQGDTLTFDVPYKFPGLDTTYRVRIDTITESVVNGIVLKKYKAIDLDGYISYDQFYYMDRIGGMDWFYERGIIIPEAGGPIRCYADADLDTNFQNIACDHRKTIAVKEFKKEDHIEVYPNPASDILHITSDHVVQKIELRDLRGKLIVTEEESILDISAFDNGCYFLRIYLESGERVTKKIIKNSR